MKINWRTSVYWILFSYGGIVALLLEGAVTLAFGATAAALLRTWLRY